MPALSSTMTSGKVVQWLKAKGDLVAAGEAVLVVESDKVRAFKSNSNCGTGWQPSLGG